jgi:hypothetical protein
MAISATPTVPAVDQEEPVPSETIEQDQDGVERQRDAVDHAALDEFP